MRDWREGGTDKYVPVTGAAAFRAECVFGSREVLAIVPGSVVGNAREDAVELEDPRFARVLRQLPSVLDYAGHGGRGDGVPARDSSLSVSGRFHIHILRTFQVLSKSHLCIYG